MRGRSWRTPEASARERGPHGGRPGPGIELGGGEQAPALGRGGAPAALVALMGLRFSPRESPSISWSMISGIPSPSLRCRCLATCILERGRDIITSTVV